VENARAQIIYFTCGSIGRATRVDSCTSQTGYAMDVHDRTMVSHDPTTIRARRFAVHFSGFPLPICGRFWSSGNHRCSQPRRLESCLQCGKRKTREAAGCITYPSCGSRCANLPEPFSVSKHVAISVHRTYPPTRN
jgi:hypothetical protein